MEIERAQKLLGGHIVEVRHLGGCKFPLQEATPEAINALVAADQVAVKNQRELIMIAGRWEITGNFDGYTGDGQQVLILVDDITAIFKQNTCLDFIRA
jgi:hypothetical protein